MIQQTSLHAYEDIKHNLGEKQLAVYNALKDLESANNKILAKKLGWEINRVTPRVLELRELGLVEKHSMRPCPFPPNRVTWFWRVRK